MSEQASYVPRTPSIAKAISRYRWPALAVFLVCLIVAAAVSVLIPPQRVATARLTLQDPRGNTVFRDTNSSPEDLTTYTNGRAAYATSATVLDAAGASLNPTLNYSSIKSKVSASVGSATDVLVITASAKHTSRAVDIANAVANSYSHYSAQQTNQTAQSAINALDQQRQSLATAKGSSKFASITNIENQLTAVREDAALFGSGVSQTDVATASQTVTKGSIPRNLIAGGLIGLLLGGATAIALAARRRPVENAEQVREVFDGLPLLGEMNSATGSREQGEFELLASVLQAASADKVIGVVPTHPDDDVSVIVARLAVTLASAGERLSVVVPTNVARSVTRAMQPLEVQPFNGTVLTPKLISVNPSPTRSNEVHISLSSKQADRLLVACPYLGESGGPSLLRLCDLAVLFVRRGTRPNHLLTIKRITDLVRLPVLGFVLTSEEAFAKSAAHRGESAPAEPVAATGNVQGVPARTTTADASANLS